MVSPLPCLTSLIQTIVGVYLSHGAKVNLNIALVVNVYIFYCINCKSMFKVTFYFENVNEPSAFLTL